MQPACTHIDVWTAGPSAIDRPHELLLPLPPIGVSILRASRASTPAHLYAHAQYIVVDLEEPRGLRPTIECPASGAIQQPAYGLRRITLPRTRMNRGCEPSGAARRPLRAADPPAVRRAATDPAGARRGRRCPAGDGPRAASRPDDAPRPHPPHVSARPRGYCLSGR
jgi:hypothetical protein